MSAWNQHEPLIEQFANSLGKRYWIMQHDVDRMRHDGMASELWRVISEEIARLSPEELGQIASAGPSHDAAISSRRTSLYQVHCGTWLDKRDSGLDLLRCIALTAVIAHLFDRFPAKG